MRILMVHNYYQQRGGEAEATELDIQLLKSHGHQVELYSRNNDEIRHYSSLRKGALLWNTTWSRQAFNEAETIIRDFKPQIVHVQNFFPLISPSVYDAARKHHIPIVQTLHNYRLFCANGYFFRDNKVCELCLDKKFERAVRDGCYRSSSAATLPVALMLKRHWLRDTWNQKVDAFITLTDFAREKFIQGGLYAEKIFVRPNFLVDDPGIGKGEREYAIYVGRLSEEKGLKVLLRAWKHIPEVPLKIVGDGPLRSWIEEFIHSNAIKNVVLVGRVPLPEVLELLKGAIFLVMPSIWYETFGRTIIEAYAAGTPVIASEIGAVKSLVKNGETGLLFNPGDSTDLIEKIRFSLNNRIELRMWEINSRKFFVESFSEHSAYIMLMEIYNKLVNQPE